MAYNLIWKGNRVEANFSGEVTKNELRSIVAEFYGSDRYIT